MSLDTITIVREIPVINGYCSLANNNPSGKTSVPLAAFVAATGGVVNRLSQASGTGRNGGRFGIQEWVEFTEVIGCCQADTALEDGKTLYHTNDRTDEIIQWGTDSRQ
jgi:hypothetical protein